MLYRVCSLSVEKVSWPVCSPFLPSASTSLEPRRKQHPDHSGSPENKGIGTEHGEQGGLEAEGQVPLPIHPCPFTWQLLLRLRTACALESAHRAWPRQDPADSLQTTDGPLNQFPLSCLPRGPRGQERLLLLLRGYGLWLAPQVAPRGCSQWHSVPSHAALPSLPCLPPFSCLSFRPQTGLLTKLTHTGAHPRLFSAVTAHAHLVFLPGLGGRGKKVIPKCGDLNVPGREGGGV